MLRKLTLPLQQSKLPPYPAPPPTLLSSPPPLSLNPNFEILLNQEFFILTVDTDGGN